MSAATNPEIAGASGARGQDQRHGNEEFPNIPISLTDLQDDGDKSSLESGQVSPEAFDEKEENLPFQGGHHNRYNQAANGGNGQGGGPGGPIGGGHHHH